MIDPDEVLRERMSFLLERAVPPVTADEAVSIGAGSGIRRGAHRRVRVASLAAVLVITAAVVLSVSISTTSRPAGKRNPSISQLIRAVNDQGSSWHVRLAPAGLHPRVTSRRAVAIATRGGDRLEAVALVRWSDDYPAHSQWVWAVFIDPPGAHLAGVGGVLVGPGQTREASGSYDYFVTFVDSSNGDVLASGSGYDSHLPPLPVFDQ